MSRNTIISRLLLILTVSCFAIAAVVFFVPLSELVISLCENSVI